MAPGGMCGSAGHAISSITRETVVGIVVLAVVGPAIDVATMRVGIDHKLDDALVCPECGKPLNGASGIDTDNGPDPGDFSVCIYCGTILVFSEDIKLRHPTAEEMKDIAGDERILAIHAARKGVF